MGALEKVTQMQQQGQTESQIINSLKQEGVSPKEINDALSQSKIKSALNQTPPSTQEIQQPGQGMQPSMMQQSQPQDMQMQEGQGMQTQNQPPQNLQPPMQPQTQDMQQIPSSMQPSTMTMNEPQMQAPVPGPEMNGGYNQQQYQDYYPEYAPESNIETMNEIAIQIVDEKTGELKKQLTNISSFKDQASLEINKINQRLERIESTLEELQMAIIGKIGEYGKNIQNLSKDMRATQESFGKILNPLTDNVRELQKITKSSDRPKPKTKKSVKGKDGFENYLR